ncbi:MAG: hypothetical protein ACC652_09885 [Acidimicrobiales bacterium]
MTGNKRSHSKFMTDSRSGPPLLANRVLMGHLEGVTHLTRRYTASQLIAFVFGVVALVTLLEFLNAYGIISP